MLYQVLLCSVNPGSLSQQQAEVQTTAVCDQFWLLKITAIAPEASQQAQAAHAIGKHTMLLAIYEALYVCQAQCCWQPKPHLPLLHHGR